MSGWLRTLIITTLCVCCTCQAEACTSMIVSSRASSSKRPMIWKHRDTSAESNFIERVPACDGRHAYVALYNAGDSLLREAWMGFNDAGFAIMNTASYNLAPDTATYKDREGEVMTLALQRCSTIDDFARLLSTLPRPMGVQANFGVIDSGGNGAYFETDDYSFTKYDLADAPEGVLVRTNFSFSGNATDGYGYIRYDNARTLLADKIESHAVKPSDFTESLSRSFYHSMIGRDLSEDSVRWVVDQDFIPRRSSTASVVIELNPDGQPIMWAALGYPPCAVVEAVTLDNVPDRVRPLLPGYKSQAAEEAIARKRLVFPVTKGNGQHYIDMDYLRPVSAECHRLSMINYER